MFNEYRYHNYNIIKRDPTKWSSNWHQFPGLPYIPFLTELEEWIQPIGDDLHEFMQQKWHYSIYISIAYIALILTLKYLMKWRQPFNLRLPMAIWSSVLAVFSIIGVIRCLPEFINILIGKGFTASFCNSSYYKVSQFSILNKLYVRAMGFPFYLIKLFKSKNISIDF
jgi:hypothetical protein